MELIKEDLVSDLYRWNRAYIDNIKALSYSKNTLELYGRAIKTFIEYSHQYNDEMNMKEIKTIFFTGYLAYLEQEAENSGKALVNGAYLSKSTKQTYFKAIRNFFNFINDNNDEFFTFERYLKNVKIADSSKMEEKLIYLSEDEVERLEETLKKDIAKKRDYNSYRNSLLIKLMLYAGLRISEALGTKLSDFTSEQSAEIYNIKIYAKGGKEQVGYIAKSHIEEELDYFQGLEEVKGKAFIMRTKGAKQLNRINAYMIVNIIYKKAGIKKEGLHLLRHTLAMRLTIKGVSLVVIKKILRHSNIATTTTYSKATPTNISEAIIGA